MYLCIFSDLRGSRLTASDIMEPNLTYVYPHTRVQSLVSILRTTVYHAFPVVTENRQNEQDFMKGNILVSNNIHYKVRPSSLLRPVKVCSNPGGWMLISGPNILCFTFYMFLLGNLHTDGNDIVMTMVIAIIRSACCGSFQPLPAAV